MRTIWLASYPKSGNTWLRMLLANLSATEETPLDINDLPEWGGIASARGPFDHLLLIESGLLTFDEIDALRPRVYQALASGADDGERDALDAPLPVRFVKTHDAYTFTPGGEPLLAGAQGADGAIVVVRDPRDIAPSLAHHSRWTIDEAIAFMNDKAAGFCARPGRLYEQLRQQLPSWSGYMASWLDQTDIPVHLVRYEDMHADTPGMLRRALDFSGRAATDADIGRAAASASFSELRRQEEAVGFRETPRFGVAQPFFRRGQAGGWRSELTSDQAARIVAEHGSMMRRLGYAADTAPGAGRDGEKHDDT